MKHVIVLIIMYHVIHGSVVNVNLESPNEIVNVMESGWEAQDMPDPRYAPDRCGISQSGWFCDPDGVFRNTSIGGGPAAADKLNMVLWNAANESHCPCPRRECFVHNAIILVAVVDKLKNPKGISKRNLLKTFAKELQEQHWKADDSECQQEIVIVFSMKDHAIVTEVGDDIVKSGMMTYDDVELVGGFSQNLFASHELYNHISFIVSVYKRYLDHPVTVEPTPLSSAAQQQMTSSSILKNSSFGSEEVSKLGVYETSKDSGLPSSVIAVVVLASLVFLSIIVLILTIPFCKKGHKMCFRKN